MLHISPLPHSTCPRRVSPSVGRLWCCSAETLRLLPAGRGTEPPTWPPQPVTSQTDKKFKTIKWTHWKDLEDHIFSEWYLCSVCDNVQLFLWRQVRWVRYVEVLCIVIHALIEPAIRLFGGGRKRKSLKTKFQMSLLVYFSSPCTFLEIISNMYWVVLVEIPVCENRLFLQNENNIKIIPYK